MDDTLIPKPEDKFTFGLIPIDATPADAAAIKKSFHKALDDTGLVEIQARDEILESSLSNYTPRKAQALKEAAFDRLALSRWGLNYERLDQWTIDLLLGVRG